jgi:hypothetical protein
MYYRFRLLYTLYTLYTCNLRHLRFHQQLYAIICTFIYLLAIKLVNLIISNTLTLRTVKDVYFSSNTLTSIARGSKNSLEAKKSSREHPSSLSKFSLLLIEIAYILYRVERWPVFSYIFVAKCLLIPPQRSLVQLLCLVELVLVRVEKA